MAYDYGVTYQCCLGTQSRLQIIARNITRRLINDTFQPPRQFQLSILFKHRGAKEVLLKPIQRAQAVGFAGFRAKFECPAWTTVPSKPIFKKSIYEGHCPS